MFQRNNYIKLTALEPQKAEVREWTEKLDLQTERISELKY